jgi:alpha-galactosidase
VNFFRCEGADPLRYYGAWQPTGTPQPNFHVPAVFGTLRFVD